MLIEGSTQGSGPQGKGFVVVMGRRGTGPDPVIEYRVMTDEQFPDGLACPACKRTITAGQPFTSRVSSTSEFPKLPNRGKPLPVRVLTCVYCSPAELKAVS